MKTIRILLADDHALFRAGLRRILESFHDVEVISEAADGHEALRLASELPRTCDHPVQATSCNIRHVIRVRIGDSSMSQPPGMTRQRVVAFVESQPDRQVCIACIGRALGVPHKAVHTAMLKIEATGRISRSYARCSQCGKTRIGVIAFSGLWRNPAATDGATSARSPVIFEDASTSVDDDGDPE